MHFGTVVQPPNSCSPGYTHTFHAHKLKLRKRPKFMRVENVQKECVWRRRIIAYTKGTQDYYRAVLTCFFFFQLILSYLIQINNELNKFTQFVVDLPAPRGFPKSPVYL